MKTFRFKDGDLDIEGGGLNLATGVEAVKETLNFRLNLFHNTCPYDFREGLDYFNDVIGKSQNEVALFLDNLKDVISSVDSVEAITSFTSELKERVYHINYSVRVDNEIIQNSFIIR